MVDGIGKSAGNPQVDKTGALKNAGKGAVKGGAEGGLLNKIGNLLSGNKTEAQEKPIKGLSVERSGEQGKKGEAIGCEGTVAYQGTVEYQGTYVAEKWENGKLVAQDSIPQTGTADYQGMVDYQGTVAYQGTVDYKPE